MFRTTVIAITGSVGKTTTKELLTAALGSVAPTYSTRENDNDTPGVCTTLLSIRPRHKYAIVEMGISRPGQMAKVARLVKPHVVIILSVARTHTKNYRSLDETAAEKSVLLEYLSKDGVAVLNEDDKRVRSMAAGLSQKVVRYGIDKACEVKGSNIRSLWPARLSMQVTIDQSEFDVETKLVGTHWASSVLAVLATVDVLDVDPKQALKAIATVQPFMARMQPMQLPCGAIVIRDEGNGSPDTFEAMLKVLRESSATRKILVVSDMSDSREKPRKRQRAFGRFAAEFTDMAIFLSDHGHHAVKAAIANGMPADRCHNVMSIQAVAGLLRSKLIHGDLVFLKGRNVDHLSRIAFAQFGDLGCWKHSCSRTYDCDVCRQLKPAFDREALFSEIVVTAEGR